MLPLPVYSFDVFDTVITRLLYKSTDVFLPVGRDLARIGLTTNAEAWARLRIRSEIDARRKSDRSEVTLAEIYSIVAERCGWNEKQFKQAQEIELQWEIKLILPIAQIQEKIARLRTQGHRCIFISDTYLSKQKLLLTLSAGGISILESDLFVSSEFRLTKARRTLFDAVGKHLAPASITMHIGDNAQSDFWAARQSGLSATHFSESLPNRYERALYHNPKANLATRSAVAGATRATRLSRHFGQAHQDTLWQTGANVLGPLLVGFVLWVLLDAERRNIRRLYFVARDGWIMREVALRLQPWAGNGIDLRYLHGSRQAWHLPSLDANNPAADWVLENLDKTNLDSFLGRLGLDWTTAASIVIKIGFTEADRSCAIGIKRRAMVEQLLADTSFRVLLAAAITDARKTLHDYLRQEGFADPSPMALIDIGWFGRMQDSLKQAIQTDRTLNWLPLFGYYLGLARRSRTSTKAASMCYISEAEMNPCARALHQNRVLAEIMCSAGHGTTMGFRHDPVGTVEPILAPYTNCNAAIWNLLKTQHEAATDFATALTKASDALGLSPPEISAHLAKVATNNWARFALTPTRCEADAYGSLIHEAEQGTGHAEVSLEEIAPLLTPSQLLQTIFSTPSRTGHFTAWMEGSLRRSGKMARMLSPAFVLRHWAIHIWKLLRRLRLKNKEFRYFL